MAKKNAQQQFNKMNQQNGRKGGKGSSNFKKNSNSRGSKGGNGKRWPKEDPNAGTVHNEDGADDSSHKFNDVSWYAKNPQMLEAAASKSYNNPVGVQVKYQNIYKSGIKSLNFEGDYSIPGVYVMRFAPAYGIGTDYTSPMNVVGQNIFAYLRSKISGSRQYEYQDVMLYLYALDNAFMLWNWAKRMYGYSRQYSQYNRYMPTAFSTADGVNAIVTSEDLSDFRFKLNLLAAKLSSFAVPAVMPVFTRHSWMVSNIYRDSDINKCQFYMFVPGYYYVYNETGSPKGGYLECKSTVPNYGNTTNPQNIGITNVIAKIDDCLTALSKSEDIGTISGDIKNAYGDSGLYTISPVEENYTLEPVYNEEVLNQIHNSTLVNAITNANATTLAGFNITQDPDNQILTFNPSFPSEGIDQDGAMLNMPWDNVTPANTMVGTRLTATRQTTGTGDTADQFKALGTEWVNERYIITAPIVVTNATSLNNALLNGWTRRQIGNNIIIGSSGNGAGNVKLFSLISNFDWHPLMPVLLENSDGSLLFCGMLGDISNYTLISGDDLDNMHQTAVMSEFNIPEFGTF